MKRDDTTGRWLAGYDDSGYEADGTYFSGLMGTATTLTDTSNVTTAEMSALYGRAARSMFADMGDPSPAKAKAPKAPPQREVPMAPTPGRRKIRLDE